MLRPYYAQDGITIYHGDCRDILPQLELGDVDLVLTDPPYGIGYTSHYPRARQFGPMVGDGDQEILKWVFSQVSDARTWIIWGANNFPHLLPFPGTWLCWDKRVVNSADKAFGWPFELAWVNKVRGKAHIYRLMHVGAINADGRRLVRLHPTQKPILLFRRIIEDYRGRVVLDPFMGSGTTLLAARDLRRGAIGIEIEERYCIVAAGRLRNRPYVQSVLFES